MRNQGAFARAAAVLASTVLATGFVASHAMSATDNPEPVAIDISFQNSTEFSGLLGGGPIEGFELISLELYAQDGTLIAYTEDGDPEVNPDFPDVQCMSYYEQDWFDGMTTVEAGLFCMGMPAGTYTVGADHEAPFDVFAHCAIEDGPPAEPLPGAGASITVQPGDLGVCDIEPSFHLVYLGQGALPPYSYTLDLDAPPLVHLSHPGMETLTIEHGPDAGFDEHDFGFCFNLPSSEYLGWSALCGFALNGQYTVQTDVPDGLIAGPLYCLTIDHEFFLDLPVEDLDDLGELDEDVLIGLLAFVRGSTLTLNSPSFSLCVQYLGTGVPIYVDVTGDDLTAEDLAGITVEAYDKDGILVATAKDPSLETCSAVESTDVPGADSGLMVADSSACAVLWVKPPFSLISGDEVATETYTLGISGAKVETHTLVATDLTWSFDSWAGADANAAFPGALSDALDAVAGVDANEAIATAQVTLSADLVTGAFSAGAITTLDVALAADDDEDGDGGELPETGISATGLLSLSMLALAAGGALLLWRRRLA